MKRNGLTLLILAAVGGLTLLPASTARAQFDRPFDYPTASRVDTVAQRNFLTMMMRRSVTNAAARAEMARRAAGTRAGALKIKKGTATTRFAAAPLNIEAWLKRWNPKTAEERRRLYDETVTQKAIWAQEAKARGTNLNDMAESLALSFALAYEVHAGSEKVAPGAYRWLVGDFKRTLMKDANYQGMSAADKQFIVDGALLNSTDAVRLWRIGKQNNDVVSLEKARKTAKVHLDQWWGDPVDTLVATSDKFINRPK
jgi:hypothetical protein